ncbi:AAA family ATPase [Candidatus Halobeggiatoa sp. HSG11]|nr:AAA family ATPase [Candidatus Halobeggiatoa sp. HSG11]
MKLKRFSIKGFKNFRQEVVLENMGDVCVIHGENNVGKSNVLEAMQLFFSMYNMPNSYSVKDRLDKIFFNKKEIFTFGLNNPIDISVTLDCGITTDVAIYTSISNDGNFIIKNSKSSSSPTCFEDFIKKHFELIGVDRQINDKETESKRCIVPQSLLLQLYDIKDSPDPEIFEKWELFISTLQKFNDILGEGEFISVFDRESNRANLVFQPETKPRRRIPIEILGSGIQQVVALITRLLVSDADFIAIEEPELNLRYTLQVRLQEIIAEIVKAPIGPQQIFLTSHSPAFEFGEHFYAMKATNDGPIIEHRPIEQAHLFTEHNTNNSNVGKTAPQCYVTSDGLVKLPEDTCKELGIEQGGGIVILKRKDNEHVELLTDEQYFDLLEPISNE